MTPRTNERSPKRSRRAGSRAALVVTCLALLGCGDADGALFPAVRDDPPAEERYVDYPSGAQESSRVCGWVTIPSGQSAYYPCAERGPRSPVSDPPPDDDDIVEVPDLGPQPPGDPPPF